MAPSLRITKSFRIWAFGPNVGRFYEFRRVLMSRKILKSISFVFVVAFMLSLSITAFASSGVIHTKGYQNRKLG
jgi:hypothetical protein